MAAGLRFAKDDFDGDIRSVTWEVEDVASAGSYATYETQTTALYDEINKWSRGRDHSAELVQVIEDNGPGKASSPVAQAKLRLIIEGADAVTGTVYRFPIPMPDLSKISDGTDDAFIAVGQGTNSLTVMNPLHTDYGTFKTAFETAVRSPNGNAVTMVRGYIEE